MQSDLHVRDVPDDLKTPLENFKHSRSLTWTGTLKELADRHPAVDYELPELVADGGVAAETAEADLDLDEWASEHLVNISGNQREKMLDVERQRREAEARAESAEAEVERLRRRVRSLEARPQTSLEIGGQQLGPLGTTAVGTAVFLAGVGVGVGVD